MRVWLLTPTYHPIIGGAETYARVIAEGMHAAGHEVTVLTDGERTPEAAPELNGVWILRVLGQTTRLSDPTKVRWEQMYFGLLHELHALLGSGQPSVIHANSHDTAIIGSMIALALQAPLVCSFHEQEPEAEPFGAGRARLVYTQLPVSMYLAGSRFYAEKARSFGVTGDKLRLIYHGIDLEKFYPRASQTRATWGLGADDFVVVLAGRLKARKGIIDLVRALPKVVARVPRLRCIVAGSRSSASQEYAEQLYSEREKLGLSRVLDIREQLTLDDMPALYAAADVVVQPSHAEGLGLAILEAMACQRPVVGSDIPGINEIITDGRDGILIPAGSVERLAGAIIQLAHDPALAARLASEGLRTVRSRFGLARMIAETETVYAGAVTTQREGSSRHVPSG